MPQSDQAIAVRSSKESSPSGPRRWEVGEYTRNPLFVWQKGYPSQKESDWDHVHGSSQEPNPAIENITPEQSADLRFGISQY